MKNIGNALWVTDAGAYRADASRVAARFFNNQTGYYQHAPTGQDGHLHFTRSPWYAGGSPGEIGEGCVGMTLYADGAESLKLVVVPGALVARLYNATNAVAIDSNQLWTANGFARTGLHTVDIHMYTESGSAHADIYVNRTLIGSVVNPNGAALGWDTIKFGAYKGDVHEAVSELAVATTPLLGARVVSLWPATDGAYAETTGGRADVDESTPDTNEALFTAAGQRLTYRSNGLGSIQGVVQAVATGGIVAGSADLALGQMLKTADGEWVDTQLTSGAANASLVTVHAQNPITEVPWTGDLSALEFGWKASAAA